MPARSALIMGGGDREVLALLTDDELVSRACGEDRLALEMLWERYEGTVEKVIRSKLWGPGELSEVDDLKHEVFIKLQHSIAQFRDDFPAWISAIARNTTFSQLRKKKARPAVNFSSLSEAQLLEVERINCTDPHRDDDAQLVESVLSEVQPDWTGEEFIVWLDTMLGYPPREIKESRGIPVRRVSAILYKIRVKCEAERTKIESLLGLRKAKVMP